jgi:phosphoglycolate phosphatase
VVKYQLVMFDFDGTLADTLPWFMTVMDHVADKYQIKRLTDDDVRLLRGFSATQVIKHLGVPMWKTPMIAKYVRGLMARDIDKMTVFNGIDHALLGLARQGQTLALVTSNSYENASRILGPATMALFSCCECGVSIFGKHAKLKKVLNHTGVSPDASIYVGDEIRDGEAARRVQVAFGAVAWGYTRIEALQACDPNVLFGSVTEMTRKLV